MLFSLFWILVGCLDWFRLCSVTVRWLRLCYAVKTQFNMFSLSFKLFGIVRVVFISLFCGLH